MPSRPVKLHITSKSWIFKFLETHLVLIAVCNLILLLSQLLPRELLIKGWSHIFRFALTTSLIWGLLVSIIFSIYWHRRERQHAINSDLVHGWFQGIIRYWLAFAISIYGFAKILKTQFGHPYYTDDMLIGQLSGFQLTWNYFSYSYELAVIIALCQIIGSILLLFRKTTLLGSFILLPVMINILLINVFFNIAEGAFLNSVVYTIGLLYLLLLRWADLKAVFWETASKLPAIKLGLIKYIFRFISIGFAFAMIYTLADPDQSHPWQGKWTVDEFIRNGDTVHDDAWVTDQTIWKNIYVENSGRLILSSNPYVYESDRAQWADFKYDQLKHELHLSIERGWTEKDTMIASVSNDNKQQMQWTGVFKKDTLYLKLSRVNK